MTGKNKGWPLQNDTAQKVDTSTFSFPVVSYANKFATTLQKNERCRMLDTFLLRLLFAEGEGLATSQAVCLLRDAFPCRSPRGPLQNDTTQKVDTSTFSFPVASYANKFATTLRKTKGVECSTPFCFVCFLRKERDWLLRRLCACSVTPFPAARRGGPTKRHCAKS